MVNVFFVFAKESHEGMTVYPDLEEVYLYYCGDVYGKK